MSFGGEQVFNEHDLYNGKAANEDGPSLPETSPAALAGGGSPGPTPGVGKDGSPSKPPCASGTPTIAPKSEAETGLEIEVGDNNEVLLSDLVNSHSSVLASNPGPANHAGEVADTASPVPDGRSSVSSHARRALGTRATATVRSGGAEASRTPAAPSSEPSQSENRPRKTGRNRRSKFKQREFVVYWLETKYDVLSEVMQSIGEDWQEGTGPDDDVDLLWSDHAISVDRFIKMQSYQRVNHFVGMTSITKKNNLGRNLLRMKKRFPEEYRFFPDTWILPTDLNEFKLQFNGKKNKTFIAKPSDGYQGRGIFLTRDFESVPVDYNSTLVVQRYIHKPFLLDGHKFDLRLYVLVTGCDPLRIFIHEHGLVRLASEEYVEPKGKNLGRTMVHLTNYAINVENPNFEENRNPQDASDGHKRSFQAVLRALEDQGLNVEKLLSQIEDLVVKTLISVQPSLAHVYHSCQPDDAENAMCFEILGFDVLIDWKAKPWLIEVNHAPSFRAETELDRVVKFQALYDAFELLNISPEARRRYKREEQQGLEERQRGTAERRTLEARILLEEDFARARNEWEGSVKNGYRRLYPIEDTRALDYERYMEAAVDIWETLTGSTTRRKKVQAASEAADEKDGGGRRGASEDAGARRATRGGGPAARRQSSGSTPAKSTQDQSLKHASSKELSAAKVMGAAVAAVASAASAASTSTTATTAGAPSSMEKDHSSRSSCSSRRSRSAEKPPLMAGVSESLAASKDQAGSKDRPSDPSTSGNNAADSESTATPAPVPASAAASGNSTTAHKSHRHADVKAGDTIQVQTNLGWEMVTVKRKHDSGQLDIQFEDGEEMKEVMPRILKHQNKIVKDVRPSSQERPGSAAKSGLLGGQRPSGSSSGQRPLGSPPLLPGSITAAALMQPRLGSNDWTGSISCPISCASPAPRGTAAGGAGELEGMASAIVGATHPQLSSLRPPPRPVTGTASHETDAAHTATPATPGSNFGTASGTRPSSDASTGRPSSNNNGSVTSGASGRTASSPAPGEGRAQDCPDSRTRHRIQKALRDESFQQLKQKFLREHEGRIIHTSTQRGLGVEARQRDSKGRPRVRPLLPPKAAPTWSPGCITTVAYRPALAIEARSVPLPSTRPRTGHSISSMVAAEPAAPHGTLTAAVATTAPGSRAGTAVAPGANGIGAVGSDSGAANARMHLIRRQASH